MSELAVETRNSEPKNFFAGDFPTLTETGTAGAAIAEHTPVILDEDGNLVTVTVAGTANIIGISAAAAEKDEPVVYYMTGEFFADALVMPNDVAVDDIKDTLRKLSIFLR